MKKAIIFFCAVLFVSTACKKSSSEDLTINVCGKYSGIFYANQGTGIVEITRKSSISVNLVGNMMWPANFIESDYSGIILSKDGNGIVSLNLQKAGDTMKGTVYKDTLTYYHNSQLFFKGIKNAGLTR